MFRSAKETQVLPGNGQLEVWGGAELELSLREGLQVRRQQ